MLEFLMKERRDVFALLYEEDDGRAKKILQRLESIDNELDKDDIILVKCSDEGMLKTYVFYLYIPSYFDIHFNCKIIYHLQIKVLKMSMDLVICQD